MAYKKLKTGDLSTFKGNLHSYYRISLNPKEIIFTNKFVQDLFLKERLYKEKWI